MANKKNMKIELKHLTPYLPYGLKMVRNGFLGTLITIKNDPESIAKTFEFQVSCSNWWETNTDENCYKPILRPLSDLSKLITHNGETFVPMKWFEKNIHKMISFYTPLRGGLEIDIDSEDYPQTIDLFSGHIAVQKLIEWHFDVFGLIAAGLAIEKTND